MVGCFIGVFIKVYIKIPIEKLVERGISDEVGKGKEAVMSETDNFKMKRHATNDYFPTQQPK